MTDLFESMERCTPRETIFTISLEASCVIHHRADEPSEEHLASIIIAHFHEVNNLVKTELMSTRDVMPAPVSQ